jgi:predicted nucleic acid-binding protein
LIAYLDTSAVVPILIKEPSTASCRQVWDDSERRVSSRLTFIEVAAALAMAGRQGRISAAEHEVAWTNFEEIWRDVDVLDVTAELASGAADCSRTLALRGYDAVHCASAVAITDPDLVAVAGDARLLGAWKTLGLAVLDVNQS